MPKLKPMIAPQTNSNTFEAQYATMWVEDDIMCCKYSSNLHMSLAVAKSCVEARLLFSKGKSYALLVDMRGIKSTNTEARKYMASQGTEHVKAGALITGSPMNRTIGNIFLTIDKPPIPIKLFTDEQKARQWLKYLL